MCVSDGERTVEEFPACVSCGVSERDLRALGESSLDYICSTDSGRGTRQEHHMNGAVTISYGFRVSCLLRRVSLHVTYDGYPKDFLI